MKNYDINCVCGWYDPNKRRLRGKNNTTTVSGIQIWNERSRTTEIFLRNWGLEVKNKDISITKKYVLDLLTENGMLVSKPVDKSMEMNHKLGKSENQTPTNKGCYQRLVGRLIYLSHTRPT